jgi:hypothetical protein
LWRLRRWGLPIIDTVRRVPLRRVLKHVPSTPSPGAGDAPVAGTPPATKPFSLSNVLSPWIAARPPVAAMTAIFFRQMSRHGSPASSASSSAWSVDHVAEPHAPTSAWIHDKLDPNVQPLSHHRAAPLQLPPIGSPEVAGGAKGSIQMSWRAHMLLYGSRTYS